MIKLSQKQKQIVEFEAGALLVKAGPGSGKEDRGFVWRSESSDQQALEEHLCLRRVG